MLVGGALVGVAGWQAASLRVGLIVCAGFAGVALVLHIAGVGDRLRRAARGAHRAGSRCATRCSASRGPGNQTRVILLAVGLGSFFVIGVRSLQANLLQQFSLELSSGGADMFLIEILPDAGRRRCGRSSTQRKAAGAGPPRLIPVLRARVTGVRGRDVNLENRRGRARARLARARVHDHLPRSPRSRTRRSSTARSGRRRAADRRGRDGRPKSRSRGASTSGSTSTSATSCASTSLGRVVEARVSSVRDVAVGGRAQRRVHVRLPPGSARHTRRRPGSASCKAPEDPVGARPLPARSRRAVSRTSRRSTSARSWRRSRQAVDNVTLAISIVGGVALLSGVLILVGAVAMTKFQRVYEAAILRTLGASTRMLGDDARARVRRPGPAGGRGRRGRRARAQLGRLAPRARHPVAPGAGPRRDRRGRRRWRWSASSA